MPKRSPGTIDWLRSESKQIVLDDLEEGVISLDETDTAEALFYGMYQYTPEFIAEQVKFEQFKDRLAGHRKQLKHKIESPAWEMAALAHDRLKCPQKTHNEKGEKIFYWTEAMELLKQDIDDGKHLTMTPTQLQATRPNEYGEFPLKIFDRRIRQAIRKKRLINWKNDKREDYAKERKERRQKLNLDEETPQQQRKRLLREQQEQHMQEG